MNLRLQLCYNKIHFLNFYCIYLEFSNFCANYFVFLRLFSMRVHSSIFMFFAAKICAQSIIQRIRSTRRRNSRYSERINKTGVTVEKVVLVVVNIWNTVSMLPVSFSRECGLICRGGWRSWSRELPSSRLIALSEILDRRIPRQGK
jgi:hypothetical protein